MNGFPRRPNAHLEAVAFDVIGTLFDLSPARKTLHGAGLRKEQLEEWYARLGQDAAALDATGVYRPFREVAAGALRVMLADAGQKIDPERVDAFLAAFTELPAYPDVAPAFERLRSAEVRVLALTNGSADATAELLNKAELDRQVERIISIDEVQRWKPASAVYLHAARVARVGPERMALIAAHDWDIHGASRAGLQTGFVARKAGYHPAMDPPDVSGDKLEKVVEELLRLSAP